MRNLIRMMCLAMMCASLASTAMGNVFNMGPSLTSLEMVHVGNAGNTGDVQSQGTFGAVAYKYNIGKYEVTAGQYTEFLNAVARVDTYGLYNTDMLSNFFGCQIKQTGSPNAYNYSVASANANRPVNYVSWGDSARFANWLHNGQPTGAQDLATTEDGAYFLNGATSDTDWVAISRKSNATWVIPSEDEWYKAAYYDPSLNYGAGGYFNYPTSNDMVPTDEFPPGGANSANFDHAVGATTDVGAYISSESPYGTFDQGGNIWERNEAVYGSLYRGLRGGAFNQDDSHLHASYRRVTTPTREVNTFGFRVAQVPEPATLSLLALGGLAVIRRRKRMGFK